MKCLISVNSHNLSRHIWNFDLIYRSFHLVLPQLITGFDYSSLLSFVTWNHGPPKQLLAPLAVVTKKNAEF